MDTLKTAEQHNLEHGVQPSVYRKATPQREREDIKALEKLEPGDLIRSLVEGEYFADDPPLHNLLKRKLKL